MTRLIGAGRATVTGGGVWFTVTAFSRPARWYTRLAGPVVPFLQMRCARRIGRRVRTLAASA